MPRRERFRFETRIRFIDTDASGRIHYTAMFRYFESAEIEFMRTLGISYSGGGDYAFPRAHVDCDFMLAIKHDDLVEIEVSLRKLGRSSMRLEFQTYMGDALAAKGAVVIVCMDRRTGRPLTIPEELRSKLSSALSNSEA